MVNRKRVGRITVDTTATVGPVDPLLTFLLYVRPQRSFLCTLRFRSRGSRSHSRRVRSCGLTSIAGETGVGKSMWAAGASVEAAIAGWRVVYLNVELDTSTFLAYFGNYCTHERQWRATRERVRFWFCDPGIALEQIAEHCAESVEDADERVLIVLDSIDSFSESTSDRGGGNQFVEQRRWLFWAMQCRRRTSGSIAFILLGEKNAEGYLKGRKGAFTSDNVISVAYSEAPGHFQIKQEKGRYCGRKGGRVC